MLNKILNKLFYETKFSYKRVIIFAILSAFFTALFLVLPFTIHTSLANIGVYLESWILFALIIILNSEKPLEAAIKTFIFFLISQPLIYLLQVPFSFLGWQIFMYYPRWFVMTLLVIPGAYIAWYIKKDNVFSSIILSIATSYLVIQGTDFLCSTIDHFPKNLLSFIYCYVMAYLFINVFLHTKRNKIIAYIITTLALLFGIYRYVFLMGFAF